MTTGKIEQLTGRLAASPAIIELMRMQNERILQLEKFEKRYKAVRGMEIEEFTATYWDAIQSIKSTGEQSVIDFNAEFDRIVDAEIEKEKK